MINKRKYIMISLSIIILLLILFIVIGRHYPVHRSNLVIGDERIYYHESSRMIQCDVAYTDVVVYEDGTYEYVYNLTRIGNGSCYSDLYIWEGFKSYKLTEAIDLEILSLDDFLDSDFVIKRPISNE